MDTTFNRQLGDLINLGISTAFEPAPEDDVGVSCSDTHAGVRVGADDASEVPPTIAGHPVTHLLGIGGVGVIYRAEDEGLDRELAIKVLRRRHASDPRMVRFFLAESRICARLQHPGIVPIYEAGRLDDGRPYFTMKIIEGETLDSLLRSRTASETGHRRFLDIFEKVCQTVAFAHSREVVHCDLKPANVMIGAFGEVQLMDWGFARITGAASPSTLGEPDSPSLRIVGTPPYMSPEQAKGDATPHDPRVDVFGLGAILCEILTGSPAYRGETREEVLLRASMAWLEDAHARLDQCGADPDIVAVARKCISPRPEERFTDASAVARRITECLVALDERAHTKEIAAAEANMQAAGERRSRRLALALMITAMVALVAVGAGYLSVQRQQMQRERERTRVVLRALEKARSLATRAQEAPLGELRPWRTAHAAAGEAADMAEEMNVADDLKEEIAALASRLSNEVSVSEKTERFWKAREDLRPSRDQDRSSDEREVGYSTAFAEYGIDVDLMSADAIGDRLRGESAVDLLIRGLHDWAFACSESGPARLERFRKLLEAASAVDVDPMRQRIRRAWLAEDVDTLRSLAESVKPESATPWTLGLLAKALDAVAERPLALQTLGYANTLFPMDYDVTMDLRERLAMIDGTPAAEHIRLIESAVHARPESVQARLEQANLQHRMGMYERAKESTRAVLVIDPENAQAWLTLAHIHIDEGDIRSALTEYEEVLRHGPGIVAAYLEYAMVLNLIGQTERALDLTQRAIDLAPEKGHYQFLVGEKLMRLGRYLEASEAYLRGGKLGCECARIALATAQRLTRAESQYDEILAGGDVEEVTVEPIDLAAVARSRGDHSIAAHWYRTAIAAAKGRPTVAQLSNAASSAAVTARTERKLARSGRSTDDEEWGTLALDWLWAATRQLKLDQDNGKTTTNDALAFLITWREDPALRECATVAVDNPSANENGGWESLQHEIDRMERELRRR